jgi:hypothetical protein
VEEEFHEVRGSKVARIALPYTNRGGGEQHFALCPTPLPLGGSYVQISGLVAYIRNIIPDDMGIPWLAPLANRGGAMLG